MTKYLPPALLVGSLLLAPACLAASDQKSTAIGERVRPFVENKEIAGAVVLVATRNGVAHVETFGKADLEKNTPMTTDTIFWIASMTKPVTGTAIMMLQDEGKLSVEDPVAKFIAELGALKTKDGKPANLTLRHLLTHTSGMSEATPSESKAARTLADLIPAFASKPVQFEPGTKWQYCQSGINTLGGIIEVNSG